MRWLRGLAFTLAGLAVAGIALRLLNPLPDLAGRQPSRALTDTGGTLLGRAAAARSAEHPGSSGLHLLPDGPAALATRVLLARAAEQSIDAQYYIWHDDLTGSLLFEELRAAAERGVRVRLLLDDNNTAGMDRLLRALDAHPNIELRLFNPFTIRGLRLAGWAIDFARLNRRMHNKSFTVDNQATIIGGRNIGDEYFGAGDGALFVDLDALAIGPIVPEVSRDFDRYWSSASAYPAERILGGSGNSGIVAAAAERARASAAAAAYLETLRHLPLVEQLVAGQLPLTWAPVELVSDDPAKALGKAGPGDLLITRLEATLGRPQARLGIVSGYFVPTKTTASALGDFARDGIATEVVTNAFEATDVPVVHAGYAGDRKGLLQAGVKLWEIRADARGRPSRRELTGSGSGSGSSTGGVLQGSGQALHAKTFAIDGQRLFIGSFNFDPRSARLNTELGFVIHSAELTQTVDQRLARALPRVAYEVKLSPSGNIIWVERRAGKEIVHQVEPGTTALSRAGIGILALLPIEWLL